MEILAPVVLAARKVRQFFATAYHRAAGHVCVSIDSGGNLILFNEWVSSFHVTHDPDTGERLAIVTFADGSDEQYGGELDVFVGN